MPNINPETGIRYGVVSLNSLAEWAGDEFYYNGTDETSLAIERDALSEHPEWDGDLPYDFWDDILDDGEHEYSFEERDESGEIILSLGLSYLGGAPLVWVYQSPVLTHARLCSPCVPGAGDLDAKCEDGHVCYDLPADWYPDDDV